MRRIFLVLFTFSLFFCKSQTIINAYAEVSSISGGNVINLNTVNIANHSFTVGGYVVVMQMQDDVIGTNTTNISSFGDIASISRAGIYETAVISAVSPGVGTPTTITLSAALSGSYNIGSNASVQLITFRYLGSNFTTTSNITGLAWNGSIGGVIAFEVGNTLTLNHSISASQIGFRQGLKSAAAGGACNPSTYLSNSTANGFKGEGIYKSTNANFVNARGHIANGGGGGNEHNAGGAGGGNYTAGGAAGPGYGCGTPAGGIAGEGLSAFIAANRVFMGGGGGGGGQNNGFNSNGMHGGGIVLIKANTILTNNTCGTPISITANGGTAANVGNDGAGGGGAGGSIVLSVPNFTASSTCPMTISSNGGNGGNVTDGTTHAGGGGGGQGVIIFSVVQPSINITSNTLNGLGGASNSAGASPGGPGAGSNNSGIIPLGAAPLPIELIDFSAKLNNSYVELNWKTASEKNNSYFTVEKSLDAINYIFVGEVKGAGTEQIVKNYSLNDYAPYEGVSYYRLRQTDYDGNFRYHGIIAVHSDKTVDFIVYPNPVDIAEEITLRVDRDRSSIETTLHINDVTGKEIVTMNLPANIQIFNLNPEKMLLDKGIYFLKITGAYASGVKKLVVK